MFTLSSLLIIGLIAVVAIITIILIVSSKKKHRSSLDNISNNIVQNFAQEHINFCTKCGARCDQNGNCPNNCQ